MGAGMAARICGFSGTGSGNPCQNLVDEDNNLCAAGHLSFARPAKERSGRSVPSLGFSPGAAYDYDDLIEKLDRKPVAAPTHDGPFEIGLSAHARAQRKQIGKGAEKAIARLLGMTRHQLQSDGRELPAQNGREMWRLRTDGVSVLFDIEHDQLTIMGFAPRERFSGSVSVHKRQDEAGNWVVVDNAPRRPRRTRSKKAS
jgi:hypothetical protein